MSHYVFHLTNNDKNSKDDVDNSNKSLEAENEFKKLYHGSCSG